MLLHSFVLALSLIALTYSSDKFVDGASGIARRMGISPFVVGITIVALGTSAPEAIVSISASLSGASDMVIGNVLGSNIANLALAFGIASIILPLTVESRIIKRELPMLLSSTALAGYVIANDHLGYFDAIMLLAMLAITLFFISMPSSESAPNRLPALPPPTSSSKWKDVFTFTLGLVALSLSAKACVWSASNIATQLGMSDLMVGLTVVAIGTSLPEIAASVASALKRQPGIAIGNVVGSNLFNTLLVLSIPGFIAPGAVSDIAQARDYPVLIGLTVILSLALLVFKKSFVPRYVGIILVGIYIAYVSILYNAA